MVSLQDIEALVLVADSYMLELGEQKNSEQKKGCSADGIVAQIAQLIMLKEQLMYQVSIDDFGDRTTLLYNCLSTAVQTFSGSNMAIDPNAVVPGVTIVVQSGTVPQWFDVPWSDMESADEDENGARYTFRSSAILGWNPSVQDGTNLFEIGVHYDMYSDGSQGVFRFREGYGIYEGSYVRFDNFQAYIAPPLPPPVIFNIYVFNNSSSPISYSANEGGDVPLEAGGVYENNFTIEGYVFGVKMPVGTQTQTNIYNNGELVDTYINTNPPNTGSFAGGMSPSLTYEWVVTDSAQKYLFNVTNSKSDGSPSVGGRNIMLYHDGSPQALISPFSSAGPLSFSEISIRQSGTDNLTFVCGATVIPILGGDVDNTIDITEYTEQQMFVYNNN